MTCGTCKYEAVRDAFPCTGCNHGRWWEAKEEVRCPDCDATPTKQCECQEIDEADRRLPE